MRRVACRIFSRVLRRVLKVRLYTLSGRPSKQASKVATHENRAKGTSKQGSKPVRKRASQPAREKKGIASKSCLPSSAVLRTNYLPALFEHRKPW